MSIGELLDRSFSLYRNYFLLWIGIVVGPQLFWFAVNLAGKSLQFTGGQEGAIASLPLYLIGFLIYWGTAMLSQAATISAVADLYVGTKPTVASSYRVARERFWLIVGMAIVTGLAVGVGVLLCVVPGIIMAILFALAIPILVIERADFGRAIERSFAMGKEAWPQILLIGVLYFALTLVVAAFGAIIGALSAIDRGHFLLWAALEAGTGTALSTVIVPWVQIAVTLVYFDQRIRKEGFDLQVLISGLDNAAAVPAAIPPAPPPIA